jgi:small subunit ribosomal protein S6
MAAVYDLMLMLDPNAPDERHREILDEVRKMIESQGEIVGVHDWGLRRLAYEIDHRGEAAYHLFQFDPGPQPRELLERLSHALKISDGVLRFRTIRLKPGAPPPPVPRPERDRAPRRERADGGAPPQSAEQPAEAAGEAAERGEAEAEGPPAPSEPAAS